MAENLYVNPRLRATRAGAVDATHEVTVWIDELAATLQSDVETSDEAYDLLAQRERLRRVRPELLAEAGGLETVRQADQRIAERGKELAGRAHTVPNPQAWLEEAAQLEASYEDLIEPAERARWAARLLDDLDDAELMLVAAGRCGLKDQELAEQLDACNIWLAEHADAFLAASVYVQAIGQSLRPDLDELDYDLAATTLKFVDILRAAEEAERQIFMEEVIPLPAHVVNGLYERFREAQQWTEEQRRFVVAILLLRESLRRRPLGRADSAAVPESPLRCVWSAPDGTAFARAIVPAQPASAEEEIPIGFFRASDDARLAEYAGRHVRLAGTERVIQQGGLAHIPLRVLMEAKEPWRLAIGPSWEEWPLTSTE